MSDTNKPSDECVAVMSTGLWPTARRYLILPAPAPTGVAADVPVHLLDGVAPPSPKEILDFILQLTKEERDELRDLVQANVCMECWEPGSPDELRRHRAQHNDD